MTDQEYYRRLRARQQDQGPITARFNFPKNNPFYEASRQLLSRYAQLTTDAIGALQQEKPAGIAPYTDAFIQQSLDRLLMESRQQMLALLGSVIGDTYFHTLLETPFGGSAEQLSLDELTAVYQNYAGQLDALYARYKTELLDH